MRLPGASSPIWLASSRDRGSGRSLSTSRRNRKGRHMLAPKPIRQAQQRSEKTARRQNFGRNVILEPFGSPSNSMLGHETSWIEGALVARLHHVPDSEVVLVRIAAQDEPRRRKSDDRDDHCDNNGNEDVHLAKSSSRSSKRC